MNLSPIPTVLSTLRKHRVRALLMGGQACILYGAAEFSRDIDIAVSVDPANLARLRSALRSLKAETIFFPPLSEEALRRGHACHFKCRARGLRDVRLDVMSVMRGADGFAKLWARRTRRTLPGVGSVNLMSVEDLVRIKKTQREKDWPMVKRLVEADIVGARRVKAGRARFWLRECRTAETLAELADRFPGLAREEWIRRPALLRAMNGDLAGSERALRLERERERLRDRRYWAPLRAELERWRMERQLHGSSV